MEDNRRLPAELLPESVGEESCRQVEVRAGQGKVQESEMEKAAEMAEAIIYGR